jgi:hypothetical protein
MRKGSIPSCPLQPFLSCTMPDAWIFTLQTEATCSWEADEDKCTVPIGAFVSKPVDIGEQRISFQGGPRWYAEELDTAPDWDLRLDAMSLFPKWAFECGVEHAGHGRPASGNRSREQAEREGARWRCLIRSRGRLVRRPCFSGATSCAGTASLACGAGP